MPLLALGLVWAGYTLIWYGYAHITGPRGNTDLTLGDLVRPSQLGKVTDWMTKPHAGNNPFGNVDPSQSGGGQQGWGNSSTANTTPAQSAAQQNWGNVNSSQSGGGQQGWGA